METYVRGFIRASLVWLGIGVLLGLAMALDPRALLWMPAHMHANLLGFVSMMIFGVAYHVIPRFSGAPLHRHVLARVHLWVGNGGLALLVAGWLARTALPTIGPWGVRLGGTLAALGAFLFIYNIWRTMDGAARVGHPARPVRLPAQQ